MKYCEMCGHPMEDGQKWCASCGAPSADAAQNESGAQPGTNESWNYGAQTPPYGAAPPPYGAQPGYGAYQGAVPGGGNDFAPDFLFRLNSMGRLRPPHVIYER